MAVRIITDACADLPKEWAEKWGVKVLPLTVNIDGRSFQYNGIDRFEGDMTLKEFYDEVRSGKMPSTAQATPESFKEIYEEALKAGDEVLYLAFSSALSGCYNSSRLAKNDVVEENPAAENKIMLVDTLCASLGQCMMVELVCRKHQQGASLQELAEYAENMKLNLSHWFTVDDLNHLKRGGRVSGTSAFIGTLLAIKPVLHVSDDGKLIPMEKVQGRQKSLRALVDKMVATCVADPEMPVYVLHSDSLAEAQTLAKLVEKKTGRTPDLIGDMGPIIGAHVGPGTLGLFFVSDKAR